MRLSASSHFTLAGFRPVISIAKALNGVRYLQYSGEGHNHTTGRLKKEAEKFKLS